MNFLLPKVFQYSPSLTGHFRIGKTFQTMDYFCKIIEKIRASNFCEKLYLFPKWTLSFGINTTQHSPLMLCLDWWIPRGMKLVATDWISGILTSTNLSTGGLCSRELILSDVKWKKKKTFGVANKSPKHQSYPSRSCLFNTIKWFNLNAWQKWLCMVCIDTCMYIMKVLCLHMDEPQKNLHNNT